MSLIMIKRNFYQWWWWNISRAGKALPSRPFWLGATEVVQERQARQVSRTRLPRCNTDESQAGRLPSGICGSSWALCASQSIQPSVLSARHCWAFERVTPVNRVSKNTSASRTQCWSEYSRYSMPGLGQSSLKKVGARSSDKFGSRLGALRLQVSARPLC